MSTSPTRRISDYLNLKTTLLRGEFVLLICAVVCAFLIRLYFFRFHPAVEGDGVHYAELARNIVRGSLWQGFYAYRASLYQIMVAATALMFKQDVVRSGQFVSALWGSLLVIPVYLFARSIGGRSVAVVAACLTVIHQTLITFSATLYTESSYLFFLWSGLYCAWIVLSKGRIHYAAGAGTLLGVAALVRVEGNTYFVLVLAIALALALWPGGASSRKPHIIAVILLALTFLAVVGSASTLMWMRTGESPFSSKAVTNLVLGEDVGDYSATRLAQRTLSLSPGSSDFTFSQEVANTSLLGFVASHPTEMLGRIYRNLGKLDREVLIPVLRPSDFSGAMAWFFALAVLGLFGMPWTRKNAGLHLFLAAVVLFGIASTSLFFFHPRLILPWLPAFIVWASQGTKNLICWYRKSWGSSVTCFASIRFLRGHRVAVLRATVVLAALVLLLNNVRTAPYYVHPLDLAYKESGLWMKVNLPPSRTLMADNPFVPFYYDTRAYVLFPYASWPDTLSYARAHTVQYVLVTESGMSAAQFPQGQLLFSEKPPEELELLKEFRVADGDRIRLFEIVGAEHS